MYMPNKNIALDIINYNEYTRNIKHWNPYEDKIDLSFFKNNKQCYILGPINNDGARYLWNFNITVNNSDELYINSAKNSEEFGQCIDIYIQNKTGKINYINQCGDYSGKHLIKWMLEIMKNIGCEKCILQDMAEIKCDNRNENNYVSVSLIHKLWKGHTYYEDFGFFPYNHNNNLYKHEILIELNNKIKQLQELKWRDFNINNEKWSQFENKYSTIYPSPFHAFKEFTPNTCGIFYDILIFIDNLPLLNDINKIISKSIWVKAL